MRVPKALSDVFGQTFEDQISRFATEQKLLPEPGAIRSPRFLARSVVPHVERLSQLFNRQEEDQSKGLAPYWAQTSNPANLRLAYFLYFMPSNMYRVASVWTELKRLGFKWPHSTAFSGIELGSGPATGACGITAAERAIGLGLPERGHWALIEQDKAVLKLGIEWGQEFAPQWEFRPFHRKIDWEKPLLPKAAPKFQLWLMSYFLNEAQVSPSLIADRLIEAWERHLEEEGLIILVEPALKLQSRKLLQVREALLKKNVPWLKLLLPCLGHQACGALAAEEDWCHEEVSWWRPPYFAQIDKMAHLDRRTLPFSSLVVAKSSRSLEQLLPSVAETPADQRYRLVSPAHQPNARCDDWDFFVCGQEGKRRARLNPEILPSTFTSKEDFDLKRPVERGDLLLGAEIRGDVHSSRVQTVKKIG